MATFFERIFRQPASSEKSNDENLATEVTAYLIERLPALRDLLLQRLGIDSAGQWEVLTQERLDAKDCAWHDRVPDLILYSKEQEVKVIIEVKLDAKPTKEQLLSYQKHLEHERSNGRIGDWKLGTLTRWTPNNDLTKGCVPKPVSIRFNDIADWLSSPLILKQARTLWIIAG